MIEFVKMTEVEFNNYLKSLIEEYSKDCVRSKGITLENARIQSELEIKVLLPKGFRTPDIFVCFIKNIYTSQYLGQIWYIHEPIKKYTFLADIEIFTEFRNKGFGTHALKLLEEEVNNLGCKAILLHVFKHNTEARRLYEKLGYEVIQKVDTGFNMAKKLRT